MRDGSAQGPARGNDQTLSLTSTVDGHQGPSTLRWLLFCCSTFHLSPPFSSSACPPPPQATSVIARPIAPSIVPRSPRDAPCVGHRPLISCSSSFPVKMKFVRDANFKIVTLCLVFSIWRNDGTCQEMTNRAARSPRIAMIGIKALWVKIWL